MRIRSEAVASVDTEEGWEGILELATRATAAPETIGIALAEEGRTAHDQQLVAVLDTDDQSRVALAWGYVVARFRAEGWKWLEPIVKAGTNRTPRHLARLLLCTFDIHAIGKGPDRSAPRWNGNTGSGSAPTAWGTTIPT